MLLKLCMYNKPDDCMNKRNPAFVFIFSIITLGIYTLYWFVKTRRELVDRGASIPTTLLMIIPIANLYYVYK